MKNIIFLLALTLSMSACMNDDTSSMKDNTAPAMMEETSTNELETGKSTDEYLDNAQKDLLKLEQLLEKKKELEGKESSFLDLFIQPAYAAEDFITDEQLASMSLEEIQSLIDELTASVQANTELALESVESSTDSDTVAESLEAISETQALVIDTLSTYEDESISSLVDDSTASLAEVDEAVAEVSAAIAAGEPVEIPTFETMVEEIIADGGRVPLKKFDKKFIAEKKLAKAEEKISRLESDLTAAGLSEEEVAARVEEAKQRHEEAKAAIAEGDFKKAARTALHSASKASNNMRLLKKQQKFLADPEAAAEKLEERLSTLEGAELDDEMKAHLEEAKAALESGDMMAAHRLMNNTHSEMMKEATQEFRAERKEIRKEFFQEMKDLGDQVAAGELDQSEAQVMRSELVKSRINDQKALFQEKKEEFKSGKLVPGKDKLNAFEKEKFNEFKSDWKEKKTEAVNNFREKMRMKGEDAGEKMEIRMEERTEMMEKKLEELELDDPEKAAEMREIHDGNMEMRKEMQEKRQELKGEMKEEAGKMREEVKGMREDGREMMEEKRGEIKELMHDNKEKMMDADPEEREEMMKEMQEKRHEIKGEMKEKKDKMHEEMTDKRGEYKEKMGEMMEKHKEDVAPTRKTIQENKETIKRELAPSMNDKMKKKMENKTKSVNQGAKNGLTPDQMKKAKDYKKMQEKRAEKKY